MIKLIEKIALAIPVQQLGRYLFHLQSLTSHKDHLHIHYCYTTKVWGKQDLF